MPEILKALVTPFKLNKVGGCPFISVKSRDMTAHVGRGFAMLVGEGNVQWRTKRAATRRFT